MNLSRTHIIILAVISIFTGMIAPTISGADGAFPYAMTNMQYVAYGILFLLTGLFLSANLRMKKISYIFIASLIVLIFSLFMMTIAWMVKNFSGGSLVYLSWGWLFLATGLGLLVSTLLIHFEEEHKAALSEYYEKIIGIVGMIVLLILSTFIVFVSHKTDKKTNSENHISAIFKKQATTMTGAVATPSFENISHIYFDRTKDFLSFVATASGESIVYPEKIALKSPDTLKKIAHIGDKTFFIQQDGSVIFNKESIGKTNISTNENGFLWYENTQGKIVTESEQGSNIFDIEGKNIDRVTYQEGSNDVYWRSNIEGGQALYKNGKKISETYPTILRYAVSRDGNLTYIAEDNNKQRVVIKNGTIVHTIQDNYVMGTLQMNGNDVLYAVKNSDDESYSVIINGTIIDRRLDEIREIFLEKNGNGFSYFGRPQGENRYCFFTRYRGNLCGMDAYMNPNTEWDDVGVIFAGLRDGKWSIYRNTNIFISDINYGGKSDISHDYFFFDQKNPRYYIFIEKFPQGYIINKQGKKLPNYWEDIDVENVKFGYDASIIVSVKDANGWKLLEI